jgi:hypothetical protein
VAFAVVSGYSISIQEGVMPVKKAKPAKSNFKNPMNVKIGQKFEKIKTMRDMKTKMPKAKV